MNETEIMAMLLDNWYEPIVFVDAEHIIRYMNAPAKNMYAEWGDVLGKSIFNCHIEKSALIIKDAFNKLKDGQDEALFDDNGKRRGYLRALRDHDGRLLGYYARSEPKGSFIPEIIKYL